MVFSDFVEVIARVDKPEARNPFLDATLTGSFAKTDGTDRKTVEGFCDSAALAFLALNLLK